MKSGSALNRIVLKDINKMIFPFPSTNTEQELIGKRLVAISERIKNEGDSLKKHIQVKKGLMQDLLTGKVRVNT